MNYTALYRKYRPQSFDEIVGQPVTVQILQNILRSGRISHAYLFSGPRGTGKTSAAKIFARALNCTSDHGDKPCGVCDSCQMALEQNHPDIVEIDAASNNGVDEVRNLIDQIKYPPMEGQYKVFIIDEVHMMSQGAFNALLKTIEEPPEYVIFIFATTEPFKVLPTILSRCLQFEFTKVSDNQIKKRLDYVCQKEGIHIDDPALSLIAQLSDGGLRDALSILDQCISYDPDHISLETVETVFGLSSQEEMTKLLSMLYSNQIEEAISFLNEIYYSGKDLKQFVNGLIQTIKEALLFFLDSQSKLVSQESKDRFAQNLKGISIRLLYNLLDDLTAVSGKLATNQSTLTRLETILLKNSFQNRIEESKEPAPVHLNSENDQIRTISSQSDQKSDGYEFISEIDPKALNHGLQASPSPSDFSCETSYKNLKYSENRLLNSDELEELLKLLVIASKESKQEEQKKWKDFESQMSTVPEMRLASRLNGSSIMASTPDTLLLRDLSLEEAREINIIQAESGFEKIVEKLIGTPKKIKALSKEQAAQLIKEFVNRTKSNSLPRQQELKENENPVNSMDEKAAHLKEILPDLIIVDED